MLAYGLLHTLIHKKINILEPLKFYITYKSSKVSFMQSILENS
jgi:hypothetical protein